MCSAGSIGEVSPKKKKNCNKTADKNIKLHHVTAELGRAVGEEDEKVRDTTFWRERVNFIVAPSQSLGFFFFAHFLHISTKLSA